MISGAVRESEHPTMMANGCCSFAVSARRAATGLLVLTLLWANRSLPTFRRLRASSGATEEMLGSAAIVQPLRAIAVINMRLQGCSFIIGGFFGLIVWSPTDRQSLCHLVLRK